MSFVSEFMSANRHISGPHNVPTGAPSRISDLSSNINYESTSSAQLADDKLKRLRLVSLPSFELMSVPHPMSQSDIVCDLSTGSSRPLQFQKRSLQEFPRHCTSRNPCYTEDDCFPLFLATYQYGLSQMYPCLFVLLTVSRR